MGIRENVFFTTVAPIIGGIIGLLMFMSPLKAVLEVRRTAFLGALNPLPMAVTILNCLGWVLYSSHQRDIYIFWPNACALFLGVWMTLSLFPYSSAKTRDLITGCLSAGALFFAVEGFAISLARVDRDGVQLVWGITSNIILILFYAAPLSEMAKVIRQRNSAYLYWPLSLLSCMNGLLWFSYGMAIQDWMVYAINGIGALLAGIQLLLVCLFPKKEVTNPAVVDDSPRNLKSATKDEVEISMNLDSQGAIQTAVTSAASGSVSSSDQV